MVTKARALRSASFLYEASEGQWWQKTKSGKSWRLWGYDDMGLLRMLKELPAKRVFWVSPLEDEDGQNETSEVG